MIQSLYNFYPESLILGWAFLFFFGAYLVFGVLPEEKRIANYMRSKKILGVALLLWGVQVFINWKFSFRTTDPLMASVVNFVFYFPCTIMIAYSFINLLKHNYISPRRIKQDVAKVIVFTAMVVSVIFLPPKAARVLLYIAAIGFAINVALMSIHFFRSYAQAKQKADEYYTEGIKTFIQWLGNCTYIIIIFGLLSTLMSFAPQWIITIYMLVALGVFMYMFISFQNYIMYYHYVDAAVAEPIEMEEEEKLKKKKLTGASLQILKNQVSQWIADKGYVQPAINIEELARQLSTNRTYLSLYIHEYYQSTFRQFVSQLRIEEAKRLLSEGKLSISEISFEVGFSTASHFSRTFKQIAGVSPQEWGGE